MTLSSANHIGQLRLERELGRGGMGVVYLAQDTRLERQVAIKSPPAEFVKHPEAQSRFRREAKLLASLNHPNIATIHDIIEGNESAACLIWPRWRKSGGAVTIRTLRTPPSR
jgi:serine/threonine protein kinase